MRVCGFLAFTGRFESFLRELLLFAKPTGGKGRHPTGRQFFWLFNEIMTLTKFYVFVA